VKSAEELARVRIVVAGRVQGVFFRRATADQARQLGLTGIARNLPDGSVEIGAEGRRRNLEALAAWAHTGPPHARVEKVSVEWEEFRNEFAGFEVR
jgi:acylphosphatase